MKRTELLSLAATLGPRLESPPGERAIATPADEPALQATMALASASKLRMVLAGRGARRTWGNPVADPDLEIKTKSLNRIIDYAPADMVIQAQAGTTLADLNQVLAVQQQVLPLEIPWPEETTLGGLVAAAPLSLVRTGHGQVRDWLLGLTVVSAAGERLKIGSKVVKNVAGYDMGKLYCGSLGTLGAISTVTFKVRPLPEARALMFGTWGEIEAADCALAAVQTSSLDPVLGLVLLEDSDITLVMGFEGPAETVEWQLAEGMRRFEAFNPTNLHSVQGSEAAATRQMLANRLGGEPSASWVLRVSLLPSDLLAFWNQAQALANTFDATVIASALAHSGSLWLSLTPRSESATVGEDLIEGIRSLVLRFHGHLQIERMPTEHQGQLDAMRLDAPARMLMGRLKAQLDPQELLAPGRFWLADALERHG